MTAEELINIIDTAISIEKADAMIDRIKTESYHSGKVDGYTALRGRIIEAINSEVTTEPAVENKESVEKKQVTKKK